ncbi:glycosyltransferase [Methylobacterium tardum]|uniref:glycosyltransferase n=1 Tax=Methylobacterium tardum TaxID=374432 RepID=UPI00361850B8
MSAAASTPALTTTRRPRPSTITIPMTALATTGTVAARPSFGSSAFARTLSELLLCPSFNNRGLAANSLENYMKISIITPVLNAERYIIKCIENVKSVNAGDIEHIIVDGGSTDRTIELIEVFQKKYELLKLIKGPDKGQSDAMNKGARSATAPIIGMLNVDDTYENNAIGEACFILKQQMSPSLVVANCKVLDEDGRFLFWNKPSDLRLKRLLLGGDVAQFPANPSAYFYHAAVHDIIGYYDENEHYAMDVDFIFACSAKVNVLYHNAHWGNFYMRADNKTAVDLPNSRRRIRLLKRKYFKKLSLTDKLYVLFNVIYRKVSR